MYYILIFQGQYLEASALMLAGAAYEASLIESPCPGKQPVGPSCVALGHQPKLVPARVGPKDGPNTQASIPPLQLGADPLQVGTSDAS